MTQAPPVHMLREEDEDAADPDSRTDNDGKRHHEAEFYADDKVSAMPTIQHVIRHEWKLTGMVLTSMTDAGPTRQRRGRERHRGH